MTRMELEFGEAQLRRSNLFRAFTQRKGLPVTFGTGEPGRLAPGWKPKKKGKE